MHKPQEQILMKEGFNYEMASEILITGQMTANCRVYTRHFRTLFIQVYQASSTT